MSSDHSDFLAEKLRKKDVWQIDMPHDIKLVKITIAGNLDGFSILLFSERKVIKYRGEYYTYSS